MFKSKILCLCNLHIRSKILWQYQTRNSYETWDIPTTIIVFVDNKSIFIGVVVFIIISLIGCRFAESQLHLKTVQFQSNLVSVIYPKCRLVTVKSASSRPGPSHNPPHQDKGLDLDLTNVQVEMLYFQFSKVNTVSFSWSWIQDISLLQNYTCLIEYHISNKIHCYISKFHFTVVLETLWRDNTLISPHKKCNRSD